MSIDQQIWIFVDPSLYNLATSDLLEYILTFTAATEPWSAPSHNRLLLHTKQDDTDEYDIVGPDNEHDVDCHMMHSPEVVRILIKKDKNEAKTDKAEHGNGKSTEN
ncbi:hypothetical protein Tco_0855775 [Tanacetum coccineum]